MRTLWHVALFDLRQQLVDKAAIFWMFLMPMGFILFFGSVFGERDPSDVRVSLPVVNADDEFLSMAFLEQLRGESFDTRIHSPAEAEADSVDLDVRFLSIPAGFSDGILAGQKQELSFTKRAQSNVSYDAAAELRLAQTQLRFLGNLIRWNPPLEWGELGAGGLDEAEKGRFLALVAEEPKISVHTRTAGKGRSVPSGMGQSIPGMLAMFVVMSVLAGGSEAITREKSQGTLRRLATTVLGHGDIVRAKLLALVMLGMVQGMVVVVATELFGRIGIISSGFSWLPLLVPFWLLFLPYSFAIGAIGIFVSALFRTTQQAESLAWLVGMVFAGLGGCWWPLEIVPDWLKVVGHIFPTAWAMDGLHAFISFGAGVEGVLLPAFVLTLYGLFFTALGARNLRVAD